MVQKEEIFADPTFIQLFQENTSPVPTEHIEVVKKAILSRKRCLIVKVPLRHTIQNLQWNRVVRDSRIHISTFGILEAKRLEGHYRQTITRRRYIDEVIAQKEKFDALSDPGKGTKLNKYRDALENQLGLETPDNESQSEKQS